MKKEDGNVIFEGGTYDGREGYVLSLDDNEVLRLTGWYDGGVQMFDAEVDINNLIHHLLDASENKEKPK